VSKSRGVQNVEVSMDPRLLAAPGRARGPLDRLLLSLLKEERDLPVLKLWVLMLTVVVPLGLTMYAMGTPPWWMLGGHLAIVLYLFAPYILALHVSSHRQVFKPSVRWLQNIPVWLLGPFMGQSPETYRVHHMGMHHAEGNGLDDLSTTMPYQRDRWTHFAHYFLKFFFFAQVDLARYHADRGRWRMVRQMVIGEASYIVVLVGLMFVNPLVTTFVFLLPFLTARFMMMCGNWAQHAFVDQDDPLNPYKNSIVFIDSAYNRRCFNDGFHIGHHVKPNRHWAEMPEDFQNQLDRYAREGAIVFRGVDYFQVWLMLMLRQHERLARHLVIWPGRDDSIEARVALLKSKLEPFSVSTSSVAAT